MLQLGRQPQAYPEAGEDRGANDKEKDEDEEPPERTAARERRTVCDTPSWRELKPNGLLTHVMVRVVSRESAIILP